MTEAIIRLRNLTKTFPRGVTGVQALNNINLNIQQGEIFGIIGLSGADKSTLVRCINLLERPTSGSVVVINAQLAVRAYRQADKRLIPANRRLPLYTESPTIKRSNRL